jgi:FabA-like domain
MVDCRAASIHAFTRRWFHCRTSRACASRAGHAQAVHADDVSKAVARLTGFSSRVLVSSVVTNGQSVAGVLHARLSQLEELRGHFPGQPVLPAVLMLESMFQVAAVGFIGNAIAFDVRRVQDARFRRPVLEGQEVLIRVDHLGGDSADKSARRIKLRGFAEFLMDDNKTAGAEVASAMFESIVIGP